MLIMIAAIGLMLYFGSILFSSLVDMLDPTERAASAEVEEFNPYTPITIVPNDYDPTLDK